MPLDLKALATPGDKPLIEPRDIFAGLGTKPWPRLRVEQDQVLRRWFERRTERDLVIKQNTGGGKTVVGLLAAQSSLNEGVGPAAYLVPDTYLVQQVLTEAHRLGLAVTEDPRDTAFESGSAILVCTFDKVVNGRTVFGLTRNPYAKKLGTIVIDDAHAALTAARKQFTVDLPTSHPAYAVATTIFGEDLKRQSPRHGRALLDGLPAAPLRIPFWSWAEKHERIIEAIEATADDNTFKGSYFSWPLLADHAHRAVATISPRGLQLRTPCPPIEQIPAFDQARRRVYLTATLADDGVLVTELGADAGSVRTPITPERASDLGDRLILAPAALNPNVIDDSVRRLAHQFAQGDRDGDGDIDAEPVNVVVLVPSDRAAGAWEEYADHTLTVKKMKPVIDRMVAGEHLGVVVLVNKYDGVDLPGGACRLLVIDQLPTPLDPGQQREAGALAGSHSMRISRIQRLEQGMGRGIRDAEDFCAVLLLGNAAAVSLVDQQDLALFSPATRAQIEFSRRVAEQITGEGLPSVREALTTFLERDPTLKEASSKATAGVIYNVTGHVSPLAQARRRAWELMAAGDAESAVRTLREGMSAVDDIEKGWRLEELAAYQHEIDPVAAQASLKAGKQLNTSVLLPVVGAVARPVRGSAIQGRTAVDFLTGVYNSGTEMVLKVESMLDDLVFAAGDEYVDRAEAAMWRLGEHLGFSASRPEKEGTGGGPDGCWGLSPDRNAVIQLKSGTSREDDSIKKTETDQLAGALSWNAEAGGPEDCLPVLVARSNALHDKASAPPSTRVITPETLEALKNDVRAFIRQIAVDERWRRVEAVTLALSSHKLTASQVFSQHSVTPVRS